MPDLNIYQSSWDKVISDLKFQNRLQSSHTTNEKACLLAVSSRNSYDWLNAIPIASLGLNPILHGGGSSGPPLAKCCLRPPICMQMTKNDSQYKILVFSCPYIPKTVFSDDYFSRERSWKELGNH